MDLPFESVINDATVKTIKVSRSPTDLIIASCLFPKIGTIYRLFGLVTICLGIRSKNIQ